MTGRGVNCEAEDRRLRSKVRCPAPDVRRLRSAILLPSKAMSSRLGRWLRDPLFLLCVTAGLLAFVVQSGELGSADTMHRLQTTHWLWTSQPQVFPERVSRVRAARARRQTLQLVRHWPVAAHAACGSRRHMDRAAGTFFPITKTIRRCAASSSATARTFW